MYDTESVLGHYQACIIRRVGAINRCTSLLICAKPGRHDNNKTGIGNLTWYVSIYLDIYLVAGNTERRCSLRQTTALVISQARQMIMGFQKAQAVCPNRTGRPLLCLPIATQDCNVRVYTNITTKSAHVNHRRSQARGKRGGTCRGSTAEFKLEAEVYLDWPCVRCTFINAFDQEACQGCGGANLKRNRLLRERKKEVERLGRLKSARECRDRWACFFLAYVGEVGTISHCVQAGPSRKNTYQILVHYCRPPPPPALLRSLKEEALKDVLEDSDSEDDSCSTATAATSGTHPAERGGGPADQGLGNPTTQANQPPEPEPKPKPTAQTEDDHPRWGNRSSESSSQGGSRQQANDPRVEGACFIHILPPDLLLQCSEYLGDTRTLCRVREVSLGWLVTLDDREAGHRLWRPLFYRLRASGSIHAGTDATGQQHRKLKVYDLGPPASTTTMTLSATIDGAVASGAAEAAVTAADAAVAMEVAVGAPAGSPAQHRLGGNVPAASPGNRNAWPAGNPGMGLPPALLVGRGPTVTSATGHNSRRSSSACAVCGLIQREGYAGKDCEMCASPLVLVQSARDSPAAPARVAYTRVNLTGSVAAATSRATPPPPSPTPATLLGSAASSPSPTTPGASVSTPGFRGSSASNSYCSVGNARRVSSGGPASEGGGGRVSGGLGLEDRGQGAGGGRDVDWHFLVKKVAEEKRIAAGWGSLRHGWVWLQRELQVRGPRFFFCVTPLGLVW